MCDMHVQNENGFSSICVKQCNGICNKDLQIKESDFAN